MSFFEPGDVLADDGLPENGSAEDVSDGAVRRLPHLLQLELLDPGLVRGDGGALDADVELLDGVRAVDGHLQQPFLNRVTFALERVLK